MLKCITFLIFIFLLPLGCKQNADNSNQKDDPSDNTTTKEESISTNKKKKTILFFGDSLTAAYGLDPEDGYTNILQQRIDSLGLAYKVINAGNSGETSAGGKERIDWVTRQAPDVFLLELGANDGLRGINPNNTRQNLQDIINIVKEKNPEVQVIIAGMEAPPNMGIAFTSEFRNVFKEIAAKNDARLIPFFLEGVAGDPDLNLKDGIHPNEEGQKIVAENVWEVLEEML